MTETTQRQMILAHLETGATLTPLEALAKFGCFRLGARVWELRRQGWNVLSKIVEVEHGKRVAQYRLHEREVQIHP